MLDDVLTRLTTAQKATLRAAGVTDQMRSDWLHARRKPTPAEILMLAHVSGVSERRILAALARPKAGQSELLARAVGKALAGVLATLSFGYGGPAKPAANRGSDAPMYRSGRKRRRFA